MAQPRLVPVATLFNGWPIIVNFPDFLQPEAFLQLQDNELLFQRAFSFANKLLLCPVFNNLLI